MSKPDLIDVLAEVNRLRAERGMEPIDAMPKAPLYSRDVCSTCSLAVALNVRVGLVAWRLDRDSDDFHALPRVLVEFREAFDAEQYPELVA